MHHVSLNRTGPNNGDLNDKTVIAPRFQPRQHRHFRPAFDLKDAHRIGLTNHVIDLFLPSGMVASVNTLPERRSINSKHLRPRGQHSQGEAIDFEDAQIIEIILVPLNYRPPFHGGIFNRHEFVQRTSCNHHAADVLREMPRKPQQFVDKKCKWLAHARTQIESGFQAPLRKIVRDMVMTGVLCQAIDEVLRQPQGFSDITNGGAWAIGDRNRGNAGP